MAEWQNPNTLQTLLNNGSIKQDTFADAMSKMQPQQTEPVTEPAMDPYDQKMQERAAFFQQLSPESQEKAATATAIGVPLAPGESVEDAVTRVVTQPDGDIEEQTKILENKNKFEEVDKVLQATQVAEEEALRITKYKSDVEKVEKYNAQAAKSNLPPRPIPVAQDYGIKTLPATPEDMQAASMPTTKDVDEAARPERMVKAQIAAQEQEMFNTAAQAEERERKIAGLTKDLDNRVRQQVIQEEADAEENPMGGSFWDRLRMAVAVGLGAYSQATTGSENPALMMLKRKYEAIENKKKLSQEEKITREKMDLDRAQLELKKMDSATDNMYKKAQIAKMMGEVSAERDKKDAMRNIFVSSKVGGLTTEQVQLLDKDTQEKIVRLPNGNAALADNRDIAQVTNKFLGDANGALKGTDEALSLANSPDFNRLSLEDRAEMATRIRLLIGKMRVPIVGGGAMSDKEFDILLETIGNPANLTSLPSIEMRKLNTIKSVLESQREEAYKTAGITIPKTDDQIAREIQIEKIMAATGKSKATVERHINKLGK